MAKNTIIYNSHFELMEGLSDEQAGKLIKAIGKFNSGNKVSINDPLVNGIFLAIKRDFILQTENYEKKVKANRENGSKGGRPKKPNETESNPINPMGYLETQHNPQNLKDKDKDKDKDIEKYKENSNSISLEASQLRVGTSILNSQQLRKLKEFEEKFGNLDSVDYLINE
jgi:hypothetical protein